MPDTTLNVDLLRDMLDQGSEKGPTNLGTGAEHWAVA